MFVDGEFVDALSGETMEVLNPATGGVIAEVPRAGEADVDRAVAAAEAAWETWRDKTSGERKERTEWHSVVIFNENLAKVAEQYLKKGAKVYIEGQLQTRQWEKEGQKHYTTEVKADKIVLLGGGRGGGDRQVDRGGDGAGYQDPMREAAPVTDDDIPF